MLLCSVGVGRVTVTYVTYCRAVSVAVFSGCGACNCDVCDLLQGCQCCCIQWVCCVLLLSVRYMTYCKAVSVAVFSGCGACNCDVCDLLQGYQLLCSVGVVCVTY